MDIPRNYRRWLDEKREECRLLGMRSDAYWDWAEARAHDFTMPKHMLSPLYDPEIGLDWPDASALAVPLSSAPIWIGVDMEARA